MPTLCCEHVFHDGCCDLEVDMERSEGRIDANVFGIIADNDTMKTARPASKLANPPAELPRSQESQGQEFHETSVIAARTKDQAQLQVAHAVLTAPRIPITGTRNAPATGTEDKAITPS